MIPSTSSPFASPPLSSSAGPTLSSSTSSVFGQVVAPPFGNCVPSPFSNCNGCSSGSVNANSFNGFQLPTSGASLASSTPAFGLSTFKFTQPSSSTSSAMPSHSHLGSSVPTFGFPQSSQVITNGNAEVASVFGGGSSGKDNADSFKGFQLPTLGTSLSSSTPGFGLSPFGSASFSVSSNMSSAMQSFSHVRPSVPIFEFPQPSQVTTNANAGAGSVVGGFSQPHGKFLCGGSRKASYSRTWDQLQGDSNSALVSISAMAVYRDKSHEELRLEDYHLRNEGYSPFGNQQTQPISGPTASQTRRPRPETFGFPPFSFTKPLSSTTTCDTFGFPSGSSSAASVTAVSSCGTFSFPPVSSSTVSVPCEKTSLFMGHSLAKDVNSTPSSGGFCPLYGQCGGSRTTPYAPTLECSGEPLMLMSISAMFVYSCKSHEELRMEDYQQRNTRASRQDKPNFWSTASKCFQPAATSQTNQTFNPPANPFGPLVNGSGSTSNTFPGPSQGPTVGLMVQPFGFGTADGASPLTGFVNITVPNIGAVGSPNGAFGPQQLIPMSWTAPVFAFPALFTNAPATPEILRGAGVGLGGQNEKETQPTRSETVVNSLPDVQIKGKEKAADSCVPEGLHNIIEKLGFNPWAEGQIGEGSKLEFSGCILPCEEAEKDEDIFALAQFAVDQHNAITQDEKVEMAKVIGASLEPVNGGRYHIVLEARDATKANGEAKRYYASVVRKMNCHLAVLEKWLPGKA